jgi:hypothetical protein
MSPGAPRAIARSPATAARARTPLQRAGLGARLALLALGLVAVLALSVAGPAGAADRALSWASLTGTQQQALAPLKDYWRSIDASGRQKWLEVAAGFPTMRADEQERVHRYMASWAALTPAERTRARVEFQEARSLSAEERQARWEAYRALSDEERQRLSQAARPAVRRLGPSNGAAVAPVGRERTAKSNVVAAPVAARPRPVTPAVVQARPGVSTTSISAPAKPPVHHQTGLPKIIATPTFVDPATLLPRRGPQGAAVRSVAPVNPPADQ